MRYYSTTEAAAVLHVEPSWVRLLCKRGRIKTIMIGNTYAISERELTRFAAMPRRPGRPRRNGVLIQMDDAKSPSQTSMCVPNQ
jgi:excisionase family DNA binding protein